MQILYLGGEKSLRLLTLEAQPRGRPTTPSFCGFTTGRPGNRGSRLAQETWR
jgi:hypothetical protein